MGKKTPKKTGKLERDWQISFILLGLFYCPACTNKTSVNILIQSV